MQIDRPPFQVAEALSVRGGSVNEDSFGTAGPFAWVIDGATSAGGRRVCPGASDAAWYADQLSTALSAEARRTPDADPATVLESALTAVVAALREAQAETGATWPDRAEEPHGAVVLVRADTDGLAYAILGDSVIVAPDGGPTRFIADPEVEEVDRIFARRIVELRENGVTDWPTIEADIKGRIHGLYQTMNTDAGIAVAALDPSIVRRAVKGRIPWPADGRVLLATDGLVRLVEPFGVVDEEALRQGAFDTGLAGLTRRLRALERADRDGLAAPRLKCHDDVTGLALLRG